MRLTVSDAFFITSHKSQDKSDMSRLQKVETRKLQLAGTGERLMISICRGVLQYAPTTQRSLSMFACSPVPARKNVLFAGDSDMVLNIFKKCP